MTLDQWLIEQDISAEEFGRRIGATGEAVRLWRTGARRPDAELIERIVSATGGAVTVQDLHNTRLAFQRTARQPTPQSAEVAS